MPQDARSGVAKSGEFKSGGSGGGSVSGTVLDGTDPVSNATVVAIPHNSTDKYTSTTDSNGDYTISSIPTGDVHVYVEGYGTIEGKPWVTV